MSHTCRNPSVKKGVPPPHPCPVYSQWCPPENCHFYFEPRWTSYRGAILAGCYSFTVLPSLVLGVTGWLCKCCFSASTTGGIWDVLKICSFFRLSPLQSLYSPCIYRYGNKKSAMKNETILYYRACLLCKGMFVVFSIGYHFRSTGTYVGYHYFFALLARYIRGSEEPPLSVVSWLFNPWNISQLVRHVTQWLSEAHSNP